MKTCAFCVSTFTPRIVGSRQTYCSDDCVLAARNVRYGLLSKEEALATVHQPRYRAYENRTCEREGCDIVFNVGQSGNKKKFCSDRCQRLATPKQVKDFGKRRWHLASVYGLSTEGYDKMFEEQGGICAICSLPPTEDKRLAVDHSHSTGKVRGLLCSSCNSALDSLGDNIWSVLAYLYKHGECDDEFLDD